jgi:degradative hydroxymethylglutaryl-CoA reductase
LNEEAYYLSEVDDKWRRKYSFNCKIEVSLAKDNISFIERIPGLNASMKEEHEKVDTSKFYKLSVEGRRLSIEDNKNIKLDEDLLNSGGISTEEANTMIENVIGKISLPLAIVPSLKINHKEYSVPMCIEEPSVVAAVSSIAKVLAPYGITAKSHQSSMIGQVHLPELDISDSIELQKHERDIVNLLNQECKSMVARGGGVKQLTLRKINSTQKGKDNYSLDITIDVCDAMGANIVNTLAEKAKQIVAGMGIKTGISILSNYCLKRMTYSSFKVPL